MLLALGAGFALAALVRDRLAIRILPPIWLPFAAWGTWAALSLLWSVEPYRSEGEFRNEILYGGIAFWVCYIAAQARGAPRAILPLLALAAAALCAVALYWFQFAFEHYAFGRHGGPGNLSSTLITLMPCLAMAAWYARHVRWPPLVQASMWALALAFVVAAHTTLNRTIWLAFAAQFLLLVALLLFHRAGYMKRRVAGVLVVAAFLGGAGMTWVTQSQRQTSVPGTPAFKEDVRPGLWREVVQEIPGRMLLGYGFGRGILRHKLRAETGDPQLWHSHNLLLDTTIQVGLPGLALLLWLLGATIWQGWRMASAQEDAVAACGMALVAVVIGMLVRNSTDVLWIRQNALLYWGVVGVLLAWGSAQQARRLP